MARRGCSSVLLLRIEGFEVRLGITQPESKFFRDKISLEAAGIEGASRLLVQVCPVGRYSVDC